MKCKVLAAPLRRGLLCASFILLLLASFGASVRAQHKEHDMQNMPGMDKHDMHNTH